jgi:hypothetical protein
MATKGSKLDKAVESVAKVVQAQLDTLPPAAAKAKRKELHQLSMPPKKPKKKPGLKQTVETLAVIAEKYLATMPEDEQERRVAALARRSFTARRGTPSKRSKSAHTPQTRVSARGRE